MDSRFSWSLRRPIFTFCYLALLVLKRREKCVTLLSTSETLSLSQGQKRLWWRSFICRCHQALKNDPLKGVNQRSRSPFVELTAFSTPIIVAQAHQHQSWCIFHKCVTYVGNGMPKSPAILVRDIHSKYFQNGIISNAPMHIFPSLGIDKLLQWLQMMYEWLFSVDIP